jgi:anti-sigma B factor antagonist
MPSSMVLPRRSISPSVTSAGLLVLDLSEITFLDSAGLAVLVDRKQRCAGLGVRFTVVAGQRAVTRVVEVAGLADHLGLVPTLAGAPA